MGKLKISIDRKSNQNEKIQAEKDDALYQSKFDRSQVSFTKKKKSKTVDNSNKTFQDAQSSVHGPQ